MDITKAVLMADLEKESGAVTRMGHMTSSRTRTTGVMADSEKENGERSQNPEMEELDFLEPHTSVYTGFPTSMAVSSIILLS